MLQVDQDLQALFDDLSGFLAFEMGHEADAACVVLKSRIIQALLRRQTLPPRLRAHR